MDKSKNLCSVCWKPFERKTLLDPCKHTFCFVCIERWNAIHIGCPRCKKQIKGFVFKSSDKEIYKIIAAFISRRRRTEGNYETHDFDLTENEITILNSQMKEEKQSMSFVKYTQEETVEVTQKVTVENIQEETVGNTQKVTVGNIQEETVGNTHKVTVENKQEKTVGNTQKVTVENKQEETVENTQKETLANTQKETVEKTQKETLANTQKETVEKTQKETLANTQKETVEKTQKVTVENTHKVTVENTKEVTVENTKKVTMENIKQTEEEFEIINKHPIEAEKLRSSKTDDDFRLSQEDISNVLNGRRKIEMHFSRRSPIEEIFLDDDEFELICSTCDPSPSISRSSSFYELNSNYSAFEVSFPTPIAISDYSRRLNSEAVPEFNPHVNGDINPTSQMEPYLQLNSVKKMRSFKEVAKSFTSEGVNETMNRIICGRLYDDLYSSTTTDDHYYEPVLFVSGVSEC